MQVVTEVGVGGGEYQESFGTRRCLCQEQCGKQSIQCPLGVAIQIGSHVLRLGCLLVTFLGAQLEDRGHRHLSPRLMLLAHCEETPPPTHTHFASPLLRAMVLPLHKGAHEQWSRFPETSKTAGDFMAS